MSYELSNARSAPVTISLIQDGLDFYWSDTRIVSESMTSERAGPRTALSGRSRSRPMAEQP